MIQTLKNKTPNTPPPAPKKRKSRSRITGEHTKVARKLIFLEGLPHLNSTRNMRLVREIKYDNSCGNSEN